MINSNYFAEISEIGFENILDSHNFIQAKSIYPLYQFIQILELKQDKFIKFRKKWLLFTLE